MKVVFFPLTLSNLGGKTSDKKTLCSRRCEDLMQQLECSCFWDESIVGFYEPIANRGFDLQTKPAATGNLTKQFVNTGGFSTAEAELVFGVRCN